MMALLKDFAEFVVVVALIVLRVWWGFSRVKERTGSAVQSLFNRDQWWRRR
jgi:hypothetical protein